VKEYGEGYVLEKLARNNAGGTKICAENSS